MNKTKHNNIIKEWKASNITIYGSIIFGIILIIFLCTLFSWAYFIKGVSVFGWWETGIDTANVNEEPSLAFAFFILSMIGYNLFGVFFICQGITWRNRFGKTLKFDNTLILGKYPYHSSMYDYVMDRFKQYWISTLNNNNINFDSKYDYNRYIIFIKDKNIKINFQLKYEDEKTKNKIDCTVEITPCTPSHFLANTMKHADKNDLIDILIIINQMFDPQNMKKYFRNLITTK